MCDPTFIRFFATFSESLKNQDLKFHPVSVCGSLENFNGLDCAKGTHKNKKIDILGFGVF